MDWLANKNPPWEAYHAFISGHLIALDKQPFVFPVGIGENWRFLFAKCVLDFTGTKATNACKDEHLCSRLKAGIDGAAHGFQDIWESNSSKEN